MFSLSLETSNDFERIQLCSSESKIYRISCTVGSRESISDSLSVKSIGNNGIATDKHTRNYAHSSIRLCIDTVINRWITIQVYSISHILKFMVCTVYELHLIFKLGNTIR